MVKIKMTVKELIEELKKLNQDAIILRYDTDFGDMYIKNITQYEFNSVNIDKEWNEQSTIKIEVELK